MYLDSEELQPPSLRAEPSQPEEAGLGFWLVRPGGGLEGAATGSGLGDRGTFQSSWAKEELDTEPLPGDHFDSLGLAARGGRGGDRVWFYLGNAELWTPWKEYIYRKTGWFRATTWFLRLSVKRTWSALCCTGEGTAVAGGTNGWPGTVRRHRGVQWWGWPWETIATALFLFCNPI